MQAFSTLKQQMQESLDSPISYKRFAFVIAWVWALGEFMGTAPNLSRVDDMKEATDLWISSNLKDIDDLIAVTSDFNSVDSCIEKF